MKESSHWFSSYRRWQTQLWFRFQFQFETALRFLHLIHLYIVGLIDSMLHPTSRSWELGIEHNAQIG